MMGTVLLRYALHSLVRHRRRSWLSLLGIAAGVALAVIGVTYISGISLMLTRATVESGIGHLRVVPADWPRTRDDSLRLPDANAVLAGVRARPEVACAGLRARTTALLGFGSRVAGVPLVGVDPEAEPHFTRYVRTITLGRYLKPDDTGVVVVGQSIADRLHVTLDDDLMATLVGNHGEFQSAMLRIVGIVDTGSSDLDATICQVTLAELQRISNTPGASEVTVLLKDVNQAPAVQRALRATLPRDVATLTWEEVSPGLKAQGRLKEVFAYFGIFLILSVVVLGVASAQLTAALERRREFAVLAALGMRAGQIVRLLLLEAGMLGLAGGLVGILVAWPYVHYLATVGVDLTALLKQNTVAVSGIMLDPVVRADAGPWLWPFGLGIAVAATLLATIYPAWFIARTDPAAAMRVT
jgi:ABC-type lipoprotein release transport system permease subunit